MPKSVTNAMFVRRKYDWNFGHCIYFRQHTTRGWHFKLITRSTWLLKCFQDKNLNQLQVANVLLCNKIISNIARLKQISEIFLNNEKLKILLLLHFRQVYYIAKSWLLTADLKFLSLIYFAWMPDGLKIHYHFRVNNACLGIISSCNLKINFLKYLILYILSNM